MQVSLSVPMGVFQMTSLYCHENNVKLSDQGYTPDFEYQIESLASREYDAFGCMGLKAPEKIVLLSKKQLQDPSNDRNDLSSSCCHT